MRLITIALAVILLTGCTYTSHTIGRVGAEKIDASLKGSTDKPKATLERKMCVSTYKDGCL